MRTSRKGIELNKAHEGLRLDVYTNAARTEFNQLEAEIELLKQQLELEKENEETI